MDDGLVGKTRWSNCNPTKKNLTACGQQSGERRRNCPDGRTKRHGETGDSQSGISCHLQKTTRIQSCRRHQRRQIQKTKSCVSGNCINRRAIPSNRFLFWKKYPYTPLSNQKNHGKRSPDQPIPDLPKDKRCMGNITHVPNRFSPGCPYTQAELLP